MKDGIERTQIASAERNVREERLGVPPTSLDGRNIDPQTARLLGEASIMRVARPERGFPLHRDFPETVIRADLAAESRTYYDLPVLKRPVWKWYIPAYFYAGGAAGASGCIAAACQAVRDRTLQGLTARAHWMSAVGLGASALFLIADLGKPMRFVNMLRVFRPTSPMNVGTWIISAAGATSVGAALGWGHRGLLGRGGTFAGYLAGFWGLPLSTYTAVLISNTAIPLWQEGRRSLPFLFASSALASSTGLLTIMGARKLRRGAAWAAKIPVLGWFATANARGFANRTPLATYPSTRERRLLVRLGELGRIGEIVSGFAYERELGRVEGPVREPLRRGLTGFLWRSSTVLAAAGIVLGRIARHSRRAEIAAAVVTTLGSIAMRFAVLEGGKASARDPRATFVSQRARTTGEPDRPMLPAPLPPPDRVRLPGVAAAPAAPPA